MTKPITKEIFEWVFNIAFAVILAALLQSEVFAISQVNMCSMDDTLHEGQVLIIEKLSYKFHEPRTGDIVVFLNNENIEGFFGRIQVFLGDVKNKIDKQVRTNRFIKRVIATPGQEIDIRNGQVFVDGVLLDEPYIKGVTFEKSFDLPALVPEGKLFVMGDNREYSNDSRAFGFVDLKSIEGRASFRVLPINLFGSLK